MASNLSLSFNIQPLPSPPSDNEEKEENYYETEEHTSDSDTNTVVEISVSDNTLYDITEIPKTGDDSMIGWWAALCIISLVGIGATVCNLIIRKRKNK
ncbi:MAG: sortase B protein-sorting domain-containing protein [Lachnospiraceae bacterium]|nr:sortase B protein-sorting domain-containing protein [Lachnospiraceae bacterium]